MRKFSFISALVVGLFVAASHVRAADEMSATYDHQKLTELYNQISRDPAARSLDATRPDSYVAGWYCVAAPFGNTFLGWTWWLSPNLSYSQYMALGACSQAYGYVCRVACNWQF